MLPGVRKLFEKPPELRKQRTRHNKYKWIDASYYGFRDDEDGELENVEGLAKKKMRAEALAEWNTMVVVKREARRAVKNGDVASVDATKILFEEEEDLAEEEFVVHVPLPVEKVIERMVLERKKMELLRKYTSENLIGQQIEAKATPNIQN